MQVLPPFSLFPSLAMDLPIPLPTSCFCTDFNLPMVMGVGLGMVVDLADPALWSTPPSHPCLHRPPTQPLACKGFDDE